MSFGPVLAAGMVKVRVFSSVKVTEAARPPDVLANGGSVPGNWTLGGFPAAQAGHLNLANIQ